MVSGQAPCVGPERTPTTSPGRVAMSHGRRTVPIVRDSELVPLRDREVVVVVQDGRQLDRRLVPSEGGFEVEGVFVELWQIDDVIAV